MNKTELVEAIVKDKKSGFDTKAAAERAINAVLGGIKTGLKKDKKGVQLVGFGNFKVKNRPARNGFNPLTRQKIRIRASKTVTFKPGKELKKAV